MPLAAGWGVHSFATSSERNRSPEITNLQLRKLLILQFGKYVQLAPIADITIYIVPKLPVLPKFMEAEDRIATPPSLRTPVEAGV